MAGTQPAATPLLLLCALFWSGLSAIAQGKTLTYPYPYNPDDDPNWPNRMPVTSNNVTGPWQTGRATFAYNHDGMNINAGACGYGDVTKLGHGLNVAALSDANPVYPGSCGRCYEIACRPSVFKDNYGATIDRSGGVCYDVNKTVVVVIVDTCPCNYPANAYSNKRWCCGDMFHFDASFWAVDQLASPKWGVIGLSFREVPCGTQSSSGSPPLDATPPPPEADAPPAPPATTVATAQEWPGPLLPASSTSAAGALLALPGPVVNTIGGSTDIYSGGFEGNWTISGHNSSSDEKTASPTGEQALHISVHPGGSASMQGPPGGFAGRLSLGFLIRGADGNIPNVTINLADTTASCTPIPLMSLTESAGSKAGYSKYNVFLSDFDAVAGSAADTVTAFAARFAGCGGMAPAAISTIVFHDAGDQGLDFYLDQLQLQG